MYEVLKMFSFLLDCLHSIFPLDMYRETEYPFILFFSRFVVVVTLADVQADAVTHCETYIYT